VWRREWILLLLPLLLSAPSVWAQPAPANFSALSQNKTWLRLLHFDVHKNQSDVVDARFFLAPTGYRDPLKELQVSVDAIANESAETPEAEAFACRFPARARFLSESLAIPIHAHCPSFEAWKDQANPDAIQFVFAAQYMGNPASAFGHSFLRFDHATYAGLLGHAISFLAKSDPKDNPFEYALKGLFGGYLGEYHIDKYYPKIHGYGSIENRDIWEYELKLTENERRMVFEHTWELAAAGRSRYYFLDRNCSYQLLRLLQVAVNRPEIENASKSFFITPQESVKILARAGLIARTQFRPSLRQKAMAQFQNLNSEEKVELKNILRLQREPESLTNSLVASALVATLAINDVREDQRTISDVALFSRATHVRSQLPGSSSVVMQMPTDFADRDPARSHDTMQVSLSAVHANSQTAAQVSFRPGLHALNDSSLGFLPYSQMVFLETQLRLSEEHGIKLHELTVLDIKSLQPHSLVNDKFSWASSLAIKPSHASIAGEGQSLAAGGAIGSSAELVAGSLGYVLVGPLLETVRPLNRTLLRTGAGIEAGWSSVPIYSTVLHAEQKLNYDVVDTFGAELISSSHISTTWQLRPNSSLSFNLLGVQNLTDRTRSYNELSLGWAENF
jgi:hypothetical protein